MDPQSIVKSTHQPLRDPQAVGEAILKRAAWGAGALSASEFADNILPTLAIPTFEDRRKDYSEAYRSELEVRAAGGDLHAARVLLEHGWSLPQDVPAHIADRAMESLGSADVEE